ncbi:nucleotide exchange factor GrpE [uncultured Parolsenella sp.]|uniref:nucleotide exchange factor GrpE n=1 Tax=uncultured Parolsenella sp. TaxID=2083008 RepID=UPI0025D9D2E4|nr:nucleotide exchange factor GrpE [uncultured Parolsenella sp.]
MMARTTVNDKQAGATAAPAPSPEGDDVKVDIEVEGDEKPEQAADAQQDEAQAVEAEVIEPETSDDADEQARVEAAIKAGEAAAEADIKSEADALRAERDELAKKLADVEGDIEAAKAEAASAADRLSRLQADWENYRRRTERDRVTERERACEGLVKDLLPAIDDLERAISHAQATAEGNEVAQQLADGVSAVHEKVVSVLEKQGVEVIDPAGQPFDPQDHQAVGRVENADEYDETVADVYQKGYRLGGKVVRPAMVTVTYGGAKRPAEAPEGDAESK